VKPTLLRRAASRVASSEVRIANDRDADWQRVNSYVADVLKDTHVLFAKLARLQGDFAGDELAEIQRISEGVLGIGQDLSKFSKSFDKGELSMVESNFKYGEQGGAPISGPPQEGPPAPPPPANPAPPPAPPPPAPEGEDEDEDEEDEEDGEDYDVEVEFVEPSEKK
jgi:hypothetical protein